jgi:predicted RNA-binding protein with PIN domain
MPYIIDGHNLIPKISGIHLRDIDDEIELIKLLQTYCRRRGKKASVYFDNAPPGSTRSQKFGRVTAYFIRQGRSADDAIRAFLKGKGRAARNWTVITSDREVAAEARASGAQVLSAEYFSRQLLTEENTPEASPEKSADPPLTPEAIEEWMDLFCSSEKDE